MMSLPIAFVIIFKYLPLTNITMAFKDYNMFAGVWDSPWAHPFYKWFQKAFESKDFWQALRNTLILNSLDLVLGFPVPIILAILLNEIAFKRFKKVTQTVLYLPHFLSWIIISGIAKQLLAPRSGVVNILLDQIGVGPIDFLTDKFLYVATYIGAGIWKEMVGAGAARPGQVGPRLPLGHPVSPVLCVLHGRLIPACGGVQPFGGVGIGATAPLVCDRVRIHPGHLLAGSP
jgi:ABC-type polysaccharide transport system permease subunit